MLCYGTLNKIKLKCFPIFVHCNKYSEGFNSQLSVSIITAKYSVDKKVLSFGIKLAVIGLLYSTFSQA